MRLGNQGLNQLGPTKAQLRRERIVTSWGNPIVRKQNAKRLRLVRKGLVKPMSKAEMRGEAERALLAWRSSR